MSCLMLYSNTWHSAWDIEVLMDIYSVHYGIPEYIDISWKCSAYSLTLVTLY